MADTDDIQGFAGAYENERERVEAADIDDRDRQALFRLMRTLDREGLATSTVVNYVGDARTLATAHDGTFVDADLDSVEDLLYRLEHEQGKSQGTIRNYAKAARRLFRDVRDEDWGGDITIPPSPDRDVDPSELLTDEETSALFDVAKSPRDKALLGLLLDTGLRVGAIGSLRVRDIELTERAGHISINQAADVKDASATVPITWSRGYVANWLDIHPRSDDPDAAFIHTLNDDAPDDAGALTYTQLQRQLKRLADRTGDRADVTTVPREKVNPHNFRKTAISRWIRQGLSEQEIKHRATWSDDSSQFEVYSGVSDEELNDQILEHYGLEADVSPRPELETCPQCGVGLPDHARFCQSCGAALDRGAAEELDAAEEDIAVAGIEADSVADSDLAAALLKVVKRNPEVRADLVDELAHDEDLP